MNIPPNILVYIWKKVIVHFNVVSCSEGELDSLGYRSLFPQVHILTLHQASPPLFGARHRDGMSPVDTIIC